MMIFLDQSYGDFLLVLNGQDKNIGILFTTTVIWPGRGLSEHGIYPQLWSAFHGADRD